MFFGDVGPDDPDTERRRIAPDHPVFRLDRPLSRGARVTSCGDHRTGPHLLSPTRRVHPLLEPR